MGNPTTDEQDVDTHDPAGMAAFMRRRAQHSREFVKLTSEEQIRHFMQQWQKNILPHFAFRFEQGAEMIERLVRERDEWAGMAGTSAGEIERLQKILRDWGICGWEHTARAASSKQDDVSGGGG